MKHVYPKNRARRGEPLEQRLARYTSAPDERGCTLWTASKFSNGYGLLRWNGLSRLAHKAAWELVNGPVPSGLHVCHSCDTPACVNVVHLWLGTQAQNVADMDAKGRGNRPVFKGVENTQSILTDDAVREIFTSKASHAALGRKFGVYHTAIYKVRSKESWRHITDQIDIRPWTKRGRAVPVEQGKGTENGIGNG